ncbi:long-chain fatty acid transport protein 1 [Nephila pilipes]|uniref:long-chain-fatty-acid--CoA ligase n=1 Tax=Nephila pilipes TaxID=299642 RepID=A0A8X6JP61_NEPPI|nr:long-chain fatty acid transport protein 1 [Nephila pilipes]
MDLVMSKAALILVTSGSYLILLFTSYEVFVLGTGKKIAAPGMVDELSNKIANFFLIQGYSKGDEIALLLNNCPEYVCIWLGLAKIGCVTALINTNLKEDSLAHSLNCINVKALIFGRNFSHIVKTAVPFFNNSDEMEYFCFTEKGASMEEVVSFPAKPLNFLLDEMPSTPPPKVKVGFNDKMLYIYTSGTTGLPKAAIIRHSRFLWIGIAAKYISQLNDSEVFYNTLPMYHTAGGILFVCVVLVSGSTMILRKKFSASNFWKEAAKHKATVGQYIGEICRYLLNQPVREEEKQHCMKLMFGNGLRGHLWNEFQERFGIKHIVEIYGATEGNANIVNMFGKVGAVGFLPRACDRLYPVSLIKVDPETGQVLRDKRGLCIRCQPGDILVMDEDGYLYFVDRTGDTFRWRGENVSTGEVENACSTALGHVSCVVYGVEIPNVEGRAGMAAIQVKLESIDFSELYQKVSKRLPPYAIPIFIRVSSEIEATGTYKLKKVALQKEGYNPKKLSDPVFLLDVKQKTYIPLTEELYSDIITGKLRF